MTFVYAPATSATQEGVWGPPDSTSSATLIDKTERGWSQTDDWVGKVCEEVSRMVVDDNRAALYIKDAQTSRGRGRGRGGARGGAGRGAGGFGASRGRGGAPRGRGGRGGRGRGGNKHRQRREDILYTEGSMRIREASKRIAEFDLDDVRKVSSYDIPCHKDISLNGLPRMFVKAAETAKTNAPIELCYELKDKDKDIVFSRGNAFDDAFLREYIKTVPGQYPVVVTSDDVLATLMASGRSVHSWHIQMFRFKRFVFLNKSEHGRVDNEWVGENNLETGPTESDASEMDRITALAEESTKVNRYFRHQCKAPKTAQVKTEPSALGKTASMFRYREYVLNDKTSGKYVMLVRSEIDAAQEDPNNKNEFQFLRIFGLLEHLPSQGDKTWTRNLDHSTATVLMNEVKTNNFKFCRWLAQTVLAGAHLMKVGFVSRVTELKNETVKNEKGDIVHEVKRVPRNDKHVIVAVETCEPLKFATQTGVQFSNLWYTANLYISAFLKYSNSQLGYTTTEDGDLVPSALTGQPSLTAFLLKHVNEKRIELVEQETDGVDDDEEDEEDDEEDQDEEDDDDEDDGDDEDENDE